jgi:purine-nucleoside phosphorylase
VSQILDQASRFLREKFGDAPEVAVVLGSGLSPYATTLRDAQKIPSHSIPGAQVSTVVGHSGNLFVGINGKTRVAILAGRVHGFEGNSPTQVVHNVRALRLWGVKKFVITNAAGSMNLSSKPGQLVLIKDVINFTGQNPLTGQELFGGPRFPDMSDVMNRAWRARVMKTARKLKIKIREDVYAGVIGPSYETAAEIRMLHKWGAGLVGMSTVWEVVALHQMGAEILGLSCVTNFGTGVTKKPLSHDEVIQTTEKSRKTFARLMDGILQETIA